MFWDKQTSGSAYTSFLIPNKSQNAKKKKKKRNSHLAQEEILDSPFPSWSKPRYRSEAWSTTIHVKMS